MLTKRIIPCLDVMGKKVVKGRNFANLEYAGDPVALARKYNDEGADELVFLDITASCENRATMIEAVRKAAKQVFIPLTVGGGVRSIGGMYNLLRAGADKISINTAAVKNPRLVREAAERFGSQCVVIAIDAKRTNGTWEVFVKGGKASTGLTVLEWARQVEQLGAGEILLTSIDKDGMRSGYDLELTRLVSEAVNIPVIASGGAGTLKDLADVFIEGKADAALAASIFHYGKYAIRDVKMYLQKAGVEVRR